MGHRPAEPAPEPVTQAEQTTEAVVSPPGQAKKRVEQTEQTTEAAVSPQEQVKKRVEQADRLLKGGSISFISTWADQRCVATKTPDGKSKADDVLLKEYLDTVEACLFDGGCQMTVSPAAQRAHDALPAECSSRTRI